MDTGRHFSFYTPRTEIHWFEYHLEVFSAELDAHLTRSLADVESALEDLNKQVATISLVSEELASTIFQTDTSRAVPKAVNVIQNQLEQFAMLGQKYLTR